MSRAYSWPSSNNVSNKAIKRAYGGAASGNSLVSCCCSVRFAICVWTTYLARCRIESKHIYSTISIFHCSLVTSVTFVVNDLWLNQLWYHGRTRQIHWTRRWGDRYRILKRIIFDHGMDSIPDILPRYLDIRLIILYKEKRMHGIISRRAELWRV